MTPRELLRKQALMNIGDLTVAVARMRRRVYLLKLQIDTLEQEL